MSAQAASTQQLVVFSLGEEEYALPITHVQEIIRYAEPRSVPADHAWIRGVISLRGKIVPVYDLASRLGEARDPDRPPQKIVIVETAERMAGVIVDDVAEVLTIECANVDSLPSAADTSIEGIARIEDRLIVLLSPAGLFGGAAEVAAA